MRITLKHIHWIISLIFISLSLFSIKLKAQDSLLLSPTKTAKDSLFLQEIEKEYHQYLSEKNPIDSSLVLTDFPKGEIPLIDSLIQRQLSDINSPIPLDFNTKVKSFIHLYLNKRRRQLSKVKGLSRYYFPIFEPIFDKEGIPLELKYLAIIESNLNPQAVSRAGATGLWQFMYSTGKRYGLTINSYIDQRRAPIASTQAAAKYLKKLYAIYKDWILVIAAYNCGPGNVNKAIRRTGGKRNYWEIYHYLPKETRSYVPAFMAINYIFHYYNDFKIPEKPSELPTLTDTLEINQLLHFEQITKVAHIKKSILTSLNPQYKHYIIPANKKQSYPLILPQEEVSTFLDKEAAIFSYKRKKYFPKNKITAPIASNSKSYFSPKNKKNYALIKYTIQSGDNLGYIASWFNVSLRELKRWNDLYRNRIRAGKKIRIYVPKKKKSYYQSFNNLSFEEKQKRVGKTLKSQEKKVKEDPNYIYYTVKNGDNFWTIAKQFKGVSNTDIMRLNGIESDKHLKIGQRLKIKKK